MRKKFLLLMMIICSVFVVVSCGKTGEPTGGKTQGGGTFWDQDGNGVEDWQEEEITLTYATWQHATEESITIDSLMVEEFTKKYPNVKVEMQIVPGLEDEWTNALVTLQETNEVPDVFLVNRLGDLLPNNLLADITEMWNNDPQTKYIFDSVRDLSVVKGKRYVVPTAFYPQFWVVNKEVLKNAGVPLPSYDWTWEQMESIGKAVNDISKNVIGIWGTAQYYYEYPKVLDPETHPYAYGYDGKGFNYSSDAYLEAMNALETAYLKEGYVVNGLSEDELLERYGSKTADPRYMNKVGIFREPVWRLKDRLDEIKDNIDIYPGPGGVAGGNTDIAGISATCEHKQAAYQFLKWMSYSEEGVLKRFELYKKYKDSDELATSGNNYPYPIVDYGMDGKGQNAIWDNIPYGDTAPGLVSPEFLESIRNAATQANKEVIGWKDVETVVQPYFSQVLAGGDNPIDFISIVEAMQEAANIAYNNAISKV